MITMKNTNQSNHDVLVYILGLAGLISVADNWIISPILPVLAKSFTISIPIAGLVLITYMIPYGIMQPVYGFIGDRIGKLKVLQLLLIGLALGTIACAISPYFWLLCISRVITGLFAAGIIALSLALIGDEVPLSDRQKYVGKFMGLVFLGQGLSVGAGGIMANYMSWRIIFATFSIAAAISAILLQKLTVSSTKTSENEKFFTEMQKVILTPQGKVIFPLAFFTGFLLLGLYSYMGSFLNKTMQMNTGEIGIIMSLFGFSSLFTGIWAGKISKKISRKNILLLGSLFALIMPIILILYSSLLTACISTIALGIGFILIQSTLATAAFNIAAKAKGLPSAIIGLGLFAGGGMGTSFGGYILSFSPYKTLLVLFAIGIIIFTLTILMLDNRKFSEKLSYEYCKNKN
jgi:predicted MFS family arabinose efflux permease